MRLTPTNPLRSALMSVLIFEVIVFWLAFAGMVQVSGISPATAGLWVGLASVLALVATAGLRRGWGYPVAWLTQLAAIALGLLTPWMYAMGLMFTLIWIISFVLGKRLENRHTPNKEAGNP
ncbi:MAG: DUF4233 domain-containing protein [Arachnia sp.]